MLGLGVPEILFILVLALLLFGPKRLPEIGRTLGKGLNEFRKASNELKRTLNTELALDEEEQARPVRPTAPYPAAIAPALAAGHSEVASSLEPAEPGEVPPAAAPSPALERPVPAGVQARSGGPTEAASAPAPPTAPAPPSPEGAEVPVAVTAAPLDPR